MTSQQVENRYQAVMARQADILSRASGIDYDRFRRGRLRHRLPRLPRQLYCARQSLRQTGILRRRLSVVLT